MKNEVGTAPGMWFAEDEKICVALPGVPYEMKQILMDEVVPRLKERLKLDVILHQFIRTVGVPETLLAQKIDTWEEALPDFLKLAYLPGGGQVKLRLTARGSDSEFLKKELKRQTDLVLPLIKDYVYSTEDIELETIVAQMIVTHELTLHVDDQITDGVLFQKFQAFPEVQKMLLSRRMDFLETSDQSKNQIQISILKDAELETQQIVLVWGEIRVQTQVTPFPHPEVNRNVVSLVTLNLLRKIILEKWPESKSSN